MSTFLLLRGDKFLNRGHNKYIFVCILCAHNLFESVLLIGYARIVLALVSFYLMPCCPGPAVFCYLLSALLDAFDGHAARALNQGSDLQLCVARYSSFCGFLSHYSHPCLFLRYKVWCHAGHVDRPVCNHVFAGEPGTAVPVLHFLVSAQHVSGCSQPLAAPAQVRPKF